MKNELTIILTSNRLTVFDELLPNSKRTILNGDDITGGEIIIDDAERLVPFIHRCIDARREGRTIQTVLDDGKIITFN